MMDKYFKVSNMLFWLIATSSSFKKQEDHDGPISLT